MRYLLLGVIIFMCFGISGQSNVRKFKYGIKLAYTIHTLTGGRAPTQPKLYGEGGIWLKMKLDQKWSCQIDLLFVEKGTGGVRGSRPVFGDYWVKLYYFEVPFLFQYHMKRMTLEMGPGISLLTYQSEFLYFDLNPDLTNVYPFKKQEISLNAGVHFTLRKWDIGLRATHSLLPVRKQLPCISQQVYNRLLALTFTRPVNFKKKKDRVEWNES